MMMMSLFPVSVGRLSVSMFANFRLAVVLVCGFKFRSAVVQRSSISEVAEHLGLTFVGALDIRTFQSETACP